MTRRAGARRTDPEVRVAGRTPRPTRRRLTVVAVTLAVVGAVLLAVGLSGQETPPAPDPATAAGSSTPASVADAPATTSAPGPALSVPVAEPVSVSIPAIDVRSDLLRLGLNDDHTLEVPPLAADSKAGWYTGSPRPGQAGPAVILGHVDSAEYGPGVFFDLGALHPGDRVDVARADGTVAAFAVDRVVSYPKSDFATLDVYGNTPGPELRLITCGGEFDASQRSYEDNIVVFASLTG